ncbi:selenoprotein V-like isoform X2 [Micropterus dolomieu]|uniref:selenoprotein V-like isoform X2 n=1 Tax=Micropterus dolomieu TaxID=147949 RepID=UPI001E8EC338|nr:selenoprotein V-like isoform X2 [Micropterus dolomieu]
MSPAKRLIRTLSEMSIKPKSHKAMGDGEWMARLRAFVNTGLWPSGGNKPAPRQRKWYDLYQKIEKCPMQAHGQSTLFVGPKACNCGFHTVKPATQPPAEAPQSVASDSDPGATSASAAASAATPRSFLRPPLSLSMFTKSRFGGSKSDSLKPNLVARRTPSPSPSSVRTPSSSPLPPSPLPSPSSVRTPSSSRLLAPSSVRTPSPSVSSSLAVAPDESGGVPSAAAAVAASVWLPGELSKTIPVQDHRWIASTLFPSGKLRPDVKLWYEPPVLLHPSADGVDAILSVEGEGVLPGLWEAANGLWCPQEGSKGPRHRRVLPYGDRDTQVHRVFPELSVDQSDCPGPAGPAPPEAV